MKRFRIDQQSCVPRTNPVRLPLTLATQTIARLSSIQAARARLRRPKNQRCPNTQYSVTPCLHKQFLSHQQTTMRLMFFRAYVDTRQNNVIRTPHKTMLNEVSVWHTECKSTISCRYTLTRNICLQQSASTPHHARGSTFFSSRPNIVACEFYNMIQSHPGAQRSFIRVTTVRDKFVGVIFRAVLTRESGQLSLLAICFSRQTIWQRIAVRS